MDAFKQPPKSLPQKIWYRFKWLSGIGVYPDFMIIGGQKCGTTTFFASLMQHPDILHPRKKEPNYFSYRYDRSAAWYRAHYPAWTAKLWRRATGRAFHTCDASTYYLFHPQAPERVHERLPGIKLIALLREPGARAFSHYKHMHRIGAEDLPFEAALDAEEERLAKAKADASGGDPYCSAAYRSHSYMARGVYVDQLAAWTRHFPRRQLLILQAEAYLRTPDAVMKRVLEFLELRNWEDFEHKPENVGGYSESMDAKTTERLRAYFRPHNERLWEWLGERWDWQG